MTAFPPEVVKSVAVYHLPSSGDKTYPVSASATIDGALLPLDRRSAGLEGLTFNDQYELYTDAGADIRVTDKLVIESATYFVHQIFSAQFGGLAHKRCSISKEA